MKTQIDKKQLVGRIGDSYYVCDYVFKHADDFKGATGTVLVPVSVEDYENRTDPGHPDTVERFAELWRQAVEAENTTSSLEDWIEEVFADAGDETVFDMSGSDYWDMLREAVPELTEEDYPVFECTGGGRCFDKDIKFDEVYNQALLDEITQYETN